MISISNSPCFASELHACVHAITALQVVARPTSGVKKQPLCMHSHVCVCVRAVFERVPLCGKGADLL